MREDREGRIVLLARRPHPGSTKTRLIPALGEVGASRLARAFVEDLAERLGRLTEGQLMVAWTGTMAPGAPPVLLPAGVGLLEQGEGDLGQRMLRIYRLLEPPVVFVGSDCPTLPGRAVTRALGLLREGFEAVFQPALDGGYNLAGFGRDPELLLQGIPWGTGAVLEATLARGRSRRLVLLEPWYDVDEERDLHLLCAHLRSWPPGPDYPVRTARVLEELRGRPGDP